MVIRGSRRASVRVNPGPFRDLTFEKEESGMTSEDVAQRERKGNQRQHEFVKI